jgi:predicted acyltransferase
LLVTKPLAAPERGRALAIDALRGLAILGMVLASAQPPGVLPAWMYHAQQPPPTHALNTAIAGLTWQDVVLPIFLFSLGVAIPLALSRRLGSGGGIGSVVRGVLVRAALLIFFGMFRQHFDSALSGLNPPVFRWVVALAGFVVLFGIFVRLPATWSRGRRLALRTVAWTAALSMFAFVRFPDGSHFRPERIDVILVILASAALFGTLVWVATRRSHLARLAVLALVVALRLAGLEPEWLDGVPWLFRFSVLQFLCVVIPGTIVGDRLVEWMTPIHGGMAGQCQWSRRQVTFLAAVLLLFVPLVLVGVQTRQVLPATVASLLLCGVLFHLVRRPGSSVEVFIAQFSRWGVFWVLLGLAFDPFDGGTKKVPETHAWLFQSCGLAIFVLLAFTILMELRPRWLRLLVDTGQNPMLAYVGYGMVALPILGLTSVQARIESQGFGPWTLFAWGVCVTLLIGLMVQFFTRRALFWRS